MCPAKAAVVWKGRVCTRCCPYKGLSRRDHLLSVLWYQRVQLLLEMQQWPWLKLFFWVNWGTKCFCTKAPVMFAGIKAPVGVLYKVALINFSL